MSEILGRGFEQDGSITPENKEQQMEAINRALITQRVHPDGLYFDFLSRGADYIDVEDVDFTEGDFGQYQAEQQFYQKYNLNQPILILSYLRNPNANLEQLLSNDRSLRGHSPGSVELPGEDLVVMAQAKLALIERVGTDLNLVRRLQAMTRKEYSEWLIETGLAEKPRDLPERRNIEGADVFHQAMELIRSLNEGNFNQGMVIARDLESDQGFYINDTMTSSHPEPLIYPTKKGPKIVAAKMYTQYLDTGGQGYISVAEQGSKEPLLYINHTHRDDEDYIDQIKSNWDSVNHQWPKQLREYFDI